MIVDWHCHWIPHALAAALKTANVPFHPQGGATEWPQRLAYLDQLGVTRQVLSLPGLFGIDNLPADKSLPLVRIFNDETAALVARDPRKFAGLASLPIVDLDLSMRELERALANGLIGAILPNDGFLSFEAAQAWRPLFEFANGRKAHLFIHPGALSAERGSFGADPVPGDNRPYRQTGLYTQSRIAPAAITLLCTDFLSGFPDLTVQIANLGGTIPFVAERLHAIAVKDGTARPDFSSGRRVFFDTASFARGSIELAVSVLGHERIIFGSDAPIFDPALPLEGVRQAHFADSQKERILAGKSLRSF